jgi:fused signal recognition particle receptor
MGLFKNLKNLFSKKKEEIEEVKEEYNVETIEELKEELEEPTEEVIEEDFDLDDDGEEDFKKSDFEASEVHDVDLDIDDDGEDDFEPSDFDDNENIQEVTQEEVLEKIDEKKKGWFFKKEKKEKVKQTITYDKGLEKTRKEFVSSLNLLGIKFNKVNDDYFDELEEILIKADIGVNTVMKFLDRLRTRCKHENITDTKFLNEVIVDELFSIYVEGESLTDKINMAEEGPTIILMVGVNGVGKTTTIGKLANKYKKQGKKVMLIGADTFRAGAVPQLEEWARRTNSLFYGKEQTDPSGVIYDGLEMAKKENVDIVFIDTAGRLQNKVNLMKELEKVNKVIGKLVPNAPHETLLIIDATTGQNGISQAKSFKEITNITGIVLTKLDGTAKGGIVLAIKEEVNIPVKFIGLGEGVEDLSAFDIEDYIYGLFKDMI